MNGHTYKKLLKQIPLLQDYPMYNTLLHLESYNFPYLP